MGHTGSGCVEAIHPIHKIMHIDMDAFFVSVELLHRPDLRGQPVIIGGKSPRGVVSTCSYEARKFGIHSAMPSVRAIRLCPDAVWLPGDYATYDYYSKKVFEIMRRYSPAVYPLSIDEGRIDLTGSECLFGPAASIAHQILEEIRDGLGLPASGGLANSGTAAKIAAELAKPGGLIVVFPGKERAFLAPVPIEKIPGVGKVSLPRFHQCGIFTIGDLAECNQEMLARNFGPWASSLSRIASGLPKSAVPSPSKSPSRSNECTFMTDIRDPDIIRHELRRLVEKLGYRLRRSNLKAGTLTVKIRDGQFKTITRSRSLESRTDKDHVMFKIAEQLVFSNLPRDFGIRLLGIAGHNLARGPAQPNLFEQNDERTYDRFYSIVDNIKEKFGKQVVGFGLSDTCRHQPTPAARQYLNLVRRQPETSQCSSV